MRKKLTDNKTVEAIVTLADTAAAGGMSAAHWFIEVPDGRRADVFVVLGHEDLREAIEATLTAWSGRPKIVRDVATPFHLRNGVVVPDEGEVLS